MDESTGRTALVCSVAILLTVGFTAVPAAAADGTGVSISGDGISITVGDDVSVDADDEGVDVEAETPPADDPSTDNAPDGDSPSLESDNDSDEGSDDPFPEEVCTDFGDRIDGNTPYEELPWFDDLPEETQPPGVPTDIVTPRAIAGILFGATPNQCDVQDPNDPSYDPREDDVDPNADADVVKVSQRDGGPFAVVTYEATLNSSGDGPGVAGVLYPGVNSEYGDSGADVVVNDGDKDYAVEPRVRYWDGGQTFYAENDVRLLNKRLGVEVDCDGSECQPGTRGLPEFVGLPAVPAPTEGGDDDGDGFCTDFAGEIDGNTPYEELPWFDDLPEETQPPGVPTDIVTPRAIAGILFGATPNQCDVQDPNDPSYDPREDDVDPNADADVVKVSQRDGGPFAVVTYEATLNSSGDGPGVAGVLYPGVNSEYGDSGADVVVNDGDKDYAVEPRVRYWDGGQTFYAENDVRLLNKRLGVEVDCDGSECQPGTRGLPEFADYPAIPAPTGE
jgi:hypothetical protein